jgi:hypothetical protein
MVIECVEGWKEVVTRYVGFIENGRLLGVVVFEFKERSCLDGCIASFCMKNPKKNKVKRYTAERDT